jgi:hypothetical protein
VDSYSAGELDDEPLSQEIRLLGELVVAASVLTRHLTREEVDRALGLSGPIPEPPAQTGSDSAVTLPTWRTSGTSS